MLDIWIVAGALAGLIVGAVLTKSLLSGQARAAASQAQDLKNECEKLRESSQTASIEKATAAAERDAARKEAETAENNCEKETARANQLQSDLDTAHNSTAALKEEIAKAEANLAAKDRELQQQRVWIGEQTTHLKTVFSDTAGKLLKERADQFNEHSKQEINTLLEPFKNQLGEFQKRVNDIHDADTTARGELNKQIANLAETASSVGTKADSLASAMLGNVKQQGEWGQLQLTMLLEKAGFVEGKHFDNQFFDSNDEGETRIADTVLRLPDSETLVIDAKVSLPSWTRFCDADSTQDRDQALKDLITSLKAHYQSLAAKDYARIVGKGVSVPFTVMFVPIEPACIEAFRADPDLFIDAQKKKIIIVTPTTLFCVLQLVLALWSIHDRQANAMEIAEQGRKMLKKLGTFADSFASIGSNLESASNAYQKAKGQLHTGQGNLVDLAAKMKDLGIEAPHKGELHELMALSAPEEDARAIPIDAGGQPRD